jgi:regulation of enolase protein 1 (concanavalin A-like superfamily)
MEWLHEPANWSLEGTDLIVSTESGTDFWRVTGDENGAVRDNGHVYGENLEGDFDLSVQVRAKYEGQYDQAGVTVRLDDRHWFKTGVEYFDEKLRFATVVTSDYSNWVFSDLPEDFEHLNLALRHRGDAVEVFRSVNDQPLEFAVHLYLPPDKTVFAGVMSAAPKGEGFEATFRNFEIKKI